MSAAGATPGIRVEEHEIVFDDASYTATMRVVGDVSEQEMAAIQEAVTPLLVGRPPRFWLINMTRAGIMGSGARRRLAGWMRSMPGPGVAYICANPRARIVMSLVHQAVRLFTGLQHASEFFDTEEEALAWISERNSGGAAPPSPEGA